MEYGIKNVFNLYVFDENGKFVTELRTLQESNIYIYDNGGLYLSAVLIAKDALLNIDLLKFIQGNKDNNLTDFERYTKLNEVYDITFNAKNKGKKCKLVAKSVMRGMDAKDYEYLYEIPNAYIVNSFSSFINNETVSAHDLKVEIKPYNEEKDLFKMKLCK